MNKLDVVLLPEELKNKDISDCLVVVIDVLRASSTIITALASGASAVIPVYQPDEALNRSKNYQQGEAILCGERNGKKLLGFELGNSPTEYTNNKISGKVILLTTTNGIRTIELARKAEKIAVGSFLNIQAIVQYCKTFSGKVLLVCAGDRGNISLEDTVCAGMIIKLSNKNVQQDNYQYDDSFIAYNTYCRFKKDLLGMTYKSVWGRHLIKMGLKEDLIYCTQTNIYNYVPIIKENIIVLSDPVSSE